MRRDAARAMLSRAKADAPGWPARAAATRESAGRDDHRRRAPSPSRSEGRTIRWLLLGLVAVAIGAGTLTWSYRTSALIEASAAWPSVDGTVVRSQVVPRVLRTSRGGVSRTEHVYDADVRYAYEVAGRRHESATVATGVSSTFDDRAAAEARVAAHPMGRGVRVFYDPRDPARSTLVTAKPAGGFRRLNALAALFALGGLAAVLVGIRAARASWRTVREWTADPHAEARRRSRDAGWM